MSALMMSRCWGIKGVTLGQKLTLLALADAAGDDGICRTNFLEIADKTSRPWTRVEADLDALESGGLISVHRATGRRGSVPVNIYSLHVSPPGE